MTRIMGARAQETYRGARRNAGRGSRAKALKAERLALGITRSDQDRMHEPARARAAKFK